MVILKYCVDKLFFATMYHYNLQGRAITPPDKTLYKNIFL